jgi:carbon-monoxide dehydrogenase large subunit
MSQSTTADEDVVEDRSPEGAVGRGVERREDFRILTGRAEYIHDKVTPDDSRMVLVRSEHPHARLLDVDTSAAEAHPDCELVLTGEDIHPAYNHMPCGIEAYDEPALAYDRVRFLGEPVCLVVATDQYAAEDIRDLVDVEYEPLDPVVSPFAAMDDDTVLHEEVGTNVADGERFEFGDPDAAFEAADNVVEREFSYGRASGVPIETSGVIGEYHPSSDEFTIDANLQVHTLVADQVYETLGYEKDEVAIRTPADIGGSYGTKSNMHRYCALAAIASKALGGQRVAFVEDRAEYLEGGDVHSSEREYTVRIGIDDDGTIRAFDFWFVENFGAYPRSPAVEQVLKPLSCVVGPYDVQSVVYDYRVALTNKTAQSPFRGYGVPPHLFVLEAIIDAAAADLDLGLDGGDIRERNLIQPDQQPYQLPSKNVYDSGDYPAILRKAKEKLDEQERQPGGLLDPDVVAAKREEGLYRGVRPTVAIEVGGSFAGWSIRQETPEDVLAAMGRDDARGIPETLRVRVMDDGGLRADLATNSSGQGHQTIVSQLLADEFGIDMESITVGYRDSAEAPKDYGAAGSRMAIMVSGAALGAGEDLRHQLRTLASDEWGCPLEDVRFSDGAVHGPAGQTLSLAELARLDGQGDDRTATVVEHSYQHPVMKHEEFDDALAAVLPAYASASFAVNAPIVEVDAETGDVEVLKYYTIRDAGNMINPTIVEGQAHGGIVQGVGVALQEEFVYDEDGTFKSDSLFEYTLPSIRDVPDIEFDHQETPNPFTELGVKGVGEGGMIDAPAGIAASINAALDPFGVVVDQLPFTANRAKRRIDDARE